MKLKKALIRMVMGYGKRKAGKGGRSPGNSVSGHGRSKGVRRGAGGKSSPGRKARSR